MAMDNDAEELYDEFGNYIGPELESSSDDDDDDENDRIGDDDDDNSRASSAASSISHVDNDNDNDGGGTSGPMVPLDGTRDMMGTTTDRTSTAVVLHEDKVHYPEAEAVYGSDVHAVTLDEDAMDLDEPILEPVKTSRHILTSTSDHVRRRTIGHETDRRGVSMEEKDDHNNGNSNGNDDNDDDAPLIPVDYLLARAADSDNGRCVALVGHLHSGKTSLVDALWESTRRKADALGVRAAVEGPRHDTRTGGGAVPRLADALVEEQDRGLSVKSTPLLLGLQDSRGRTVPLTVVDCPGHPLFVDETTCALAVADAAILCVDCLEGVRMGTVTAVEEAVRTHGLPLVLHLNKIDRLWTELRLPPEDAYAKLRHTIEELNVLVEQVSLGRYGSHYFNPAGINGNVSFGSALHGWTVTLSQMATMYSDLCCDGGALGGRGGGDINENNENNSSSKLTLEKFTARLWGDWTVDPERRTLEKLFSSRKKKKSSSTTRKKKRTFVEFVLEPIYKVYATCLGEVESTVNDTMKEVGVVLSKSQRLSSARVLLRAALRRFFGCGHDGFVDMLVRRVPTPKLSSPAKVARWYSGDLTSSIAKAMAACDSSVTIPAVVHVTKLYALPSSALGAGETTPFGAFGRIYSGKIEVGDRLRVLSEDEAAMNDDLDNDDDDDDDDTATYATVSAVSIPGPRCLHRVKSARAGQWVILEGVDATLRGPSATLTSTSTSTSTNQIQRQPGEKRMELPKRFRPLKFPPQCTPTVKLAVEPLAPAELPKLVTALRKIDRTYPSAKTVVEESGEHVVYGTGELYLDCVMADLRVDDLEVKVSDPSVAFRETVSALAADHVCTVETTNRKNRLTAVATPLDDPNNNYHGGFGGGGGGDSLADAIQAGKIPLHKWDVKTVGRYFQTKHGWDVLDARSVWAFGPSPITGPNVLVDDTLPPQLSSDGDMAMPMPLPPSTVRDSVVQGFQWAVREGPLCEEPVRGTKVKLMDVVLAEKALHRGGGQIVPAARRVVHAALLSASPRLVEPVAEVHLHGHADVLLSDIKTLVTRRRGHVVSSAVAQPGTPFARTVAYLPLLDSFGFETDVRTYTRGRIAAVLSRFHHWALVPGDPLDTDLDALLHPLEPSPARALAREFLLKTRRRKGLGEDVSLGKYQLI